MGWNEVGIWKMDLSGEPVTSPCTDCTDVSRICCNVFICDYKKKTKIFSIRLLGNFSFACAY